MSILYIRARPIVAFDANNAEHRKHYHNFLKSRSWGGCPVRFMVESLNTDLLSHINQVMMDRYVNEEFKHERKARKANPKAKSKSRPTGSLRVVRSEQPI